MIAERLGLCVLLIVSSVLALLEGTSGIDQTSGARVPGSLVIKNVAMSSDGEIGEYAVETVVAAGWVPRGDAPKVLNVRRVTPSSLREQGLGFGPQFFPEPAPPLAMVTIGGLFNYLHQGIVEYRPHPPWPGQMTLIFDLESGHWFFRGGPIVERQTRNPLASLVSATPE